MFLVFTVVLVACGGEEPASPTPVPIQMTAVPPATPTKEATARLELLDVTFAHGLTEEMTPIQPGNTFAPDETIHLSIKLKGTPKEGLVTAHFFFQDQEISAATVDLAQARKEQGLIFAIGGNTFVGFSLTPEEPFPIDQDYRAEVLLNDAPAGTYPFAVVPPADAIPSRVRQATLAQNVTEDYQPVDPTNTFAPTDEVFLVGRMDLGIFSTLEANWFVRDTLDEDGTRTLTAQENLEDTEFYFSFLPEDGWSEGEHQVVLLIDGQEVSRYTFTVSKAAAAGPHLTYELLTGRPLPRPQVVASTPQLPPRAFDRTRAKAQE